MDDAASTIDPAAGNIWVRLVGRDAIIAHISRVAASGTRVHPSITNLLIDVNGREATASCLMSARIWPGDGLVSGEYRDGFRFQDGWRFQSRLYTIVSQMEP